MNTLILNGLSSTPFVLRSFNRNTAFEQGTRAMTSIAYFDIENGTNVSSALQNIGTSGITNITIKHDDETIYNLPNLNAQITSIIETLYEDNININVSITFN